MSRTSLWALPLFASLAFACGGETAPAAGSQKPSAKPLPPPPPASSSAVATGPAQKQKECGKGPEVTFDDPTLEKAIRTQLAKPEGPVLMADLGKVKTLMLTESKQTDFLDACIYPDLKGLKGLYLPKGQLEDISMLRNLANLESLVISHTKIKDLSPISGCLLYTSDAADE